MGRNPDDSKKTMSRLLLEYLKDSNRSDRQIAKELGVSQATISRLKTKLVKEGLVHHFSAIPDLGKIGYEILVFSFVKFNTDMVMQDFPQIIKKAIGWSKSRPEILFDARAEGMGIDAVTVSIHKTYADYKDFLAESKRVWQGLFSETHHVLVDLNGPISKAFSFEYITEESDE